MFIIYLVREIKPPNHESCFPQFFPHICFSSEEIKNKIKFSTAQDEKNSWKKLGKTGLMSRTIYLMQPPQKRNKRTALIESPTFL